METNGTEVNAYIEDEAIKTDEDIDGASVTGRLYKVANLKNNLIEYLPPFENKGLPTSFEKMTSADYVQFRDSVYNMIENVEPDIIFEAYYGKNDIELSSESSNGLYFIVLDNLITDGYEYQYIPDFLFVNEKSPLAEIIMCGEQRERKFSFSIITDYTSESESFEPATVTFGIEAEEEYTEITISLDELGTKEYKLDGFKAGTIATVTLKKIEGNAVLNGDPIQTIYISAGEEGKVEFVFSYEAEQP